MSFISFVRIRLIDHQLYFHSDIAMTQLFGSNSNLFYKTYEDILPLPEGHQIRKTIYNLYHVLNHYVLFGGGYINQAKSMIDKILKS